MLAQADRFKELYPQSIDAARKAIKITPKNAEPHMWMGDSLRLSGKYSEAKTEYGEYLRLSDFDSKLAGKLNYYVLGSLFGAGRKLRASQHDIWSEMRSLAYFGICDCERNLSNYDTAIAYCQKSLTYYKNDAFAHYALGNSYLHKAKADNDMGALQSSLQHYKAVVALNPDMDEAKLAQQNIANIEKIVR
jgi:tetratricopeptide (TPR) repeat protein